MTRARFRRGAGARRSRSGEKPATARAAPMLRRMSGGERRGADARSREDRGHDRGRDNEIVCRLLVQRWRRNLQDDGRERRRDDGEGLEDRAVRALGGSGGGRLAVARLVGCQAEDIRSERRRIGRGGRRLIAPLRPAHEGVKLRDEELKDEGAKDDREQLAPPGAAPSRLVPPASAPPHRSPHQQSKARYARLASFDRHPRAGRGSRVPGFPLAQE